MEEKIRINKFLSEVGFCSRRGADKIISQGRVYINGKVAVLGSKVNRDDLVKVDGELINKIEDKIYIAFNKPVGIECTGNQKVKNNIIDFINLFFQSLSLNQFILINSIIILITSLSFFIKKVFKINVFDRLFIVFVMISFIFVSLNFIKNICAHNNNFAIIIKQESVVYSAPFLNQAIEQSVFYSGNKVKVLQQTESWIEVSSFDGRKGWIQAQDVRNLN